MSNKSETLLLHNVLDRQAMNIFSKYKISNGAIEEHNSNEPYIIDSDDDGIYLLKRID